MLVEFSKANLLQKARQQPDKVKQVLDKVRADGLLPTMDAVFRKLDEPLPLGYCNAGVVLEVGAGVHDIQPGDRVASNGAHAELVCVPRNLCAKIPQGVGDEQAAFTVLSSIALQGLRLAEPTLGERFVVFGMGLLGLLTVQLLQANGCDCLAVDLNSERLTLAEQLGAKTVDLAAGADPIAAAQSWSEGKGVDGALITASAKTDEIMHQAAQACRKHGRIILVGVVGLNLRRSDFFEKELTFRVSCSYGPGRYDESYEQKGQDYPYGFVRWTEQRNFEAVLQAMQARRLQVEPLITHQFKLSEATEAYEKVQNDPKALGILLRYPEQVTRTPRVEVAKRLIPPLRQQLSVGVIGAGGFAKGVLLPGLAKTRAKLGSIADLNPVAARHAAQKFKAQKAITDYQELLNDNTIRAVFVVVGHHLHARFVQEVLEAGKHVFVEKPLAMNPEELAAVVEVARARPTQAIMVGFNRRFSPHTQEIEKWLAGRSEPLCLNMTVNAGAIPPDHWVQDPERGGGRIIGEACHFIDLMVHLTNSHVEAVSALMMGPGVATREDKMAITLRFADGSIGTINYFSNGAKSYPKERLEIFSDGRVIHMDNFRQTTGHGFKASKKFSTIRQDKGHNAELAAFVESLIEGGEVPIPFDQLVNVTEASFAAVLSAQREEMIHLPLA